MYELAIDPSIRVTPYGAQILRNLSFEEWRDALRNIRQVKLAYHSVLSDLTAYGRQAFGDDAVSHAFEQLEFEWSDATKAAAIGTMPLSFRTEHKLNAEHAFALTKLDDDDRLKWAVICCEHGLSPLELKRSIELDRVIRLAEIQTTSGQGTGVVTIQGLRFRFEQWTRQMGEPERIMSLTKQERRKILDHLTPFVALAARLQESL